MSVTVDDQPLPAESLGLTTVGQVLSYLRAKKRLVVHMMIDGQEPDFAKLEALYAQPVNRNALFIETADPKEIADDVFNQVESLLADSESLREQAVSHLQAGEHAEALKKLGTCFVTWNHTQESVQKVSRLLNIDLQTVRLEDQTLQQWLQAFAQQLTDIRAALESRDYVMLSDILAYEAHETSNRWREALDAMRSSMD